MTRALAMDIECFELARPFTISTGSIESLTVLRVELREHGCVGQGECVPSAAQMVSRREGDRMALAVRDQIEQIRPAIEAGATTVDLLELLPSGPARNAVDCALWDLAAKRADRPVGDLLGVTVPDSLVTAYTISLGSPAEIAAEAYAHRDRGLLKLKLGSSADVEIVAAVRGAAPDADIIVDVNGGWSIEQFGDLAGALHALGVRLIEQPLPAGADEALADFDSPVPIAADESCQDCADLESVSTRYGFVNIKLDKTGGLTEALELARRARALGLGVMVGCMAGTSLSMAPAAVIGALADVVDLDGPLLLRTDRPNAMTYVGDRILCKNRALWG